MFSDEGDAVTATLGDGESPSLSVSVSRCEAELDTVRPVSVRESDTVVDFVALFVGERVADLLPCGVAVLGGDSDAVLLTLDVASRVDVPLGDADAADMLDLTRRTEPGPFKVRTHTMGNYIGLRDGGKLIAMAGERLRIGGYVEISTVCVDDAYRGRGIANRLIRILQNEIGQRGQTPFLHVLDHNSGAFGLYERMGFERRQSFHLTRLQRQEPA